MDEDELLTTKQAGDLLGVSQRTVSRMTDSNEIPYQTTPGGQVRIWKSAVLTYLAKTSRRPSGPEEICVLNQKGGVGKTTVSVNLGVLLAQAGARVLLVDLDPQGNTTLSLGFDPDSFARTLQHSLLNPRTVPLADVIVHTTAGVDLVPLNLAASRMDVELSGDPMWGMRLRNQLDPVRHLYDYIIYDCGPSLNKLTVMGLLAARWVIIPTQPQQLSIHGLRILLEQIDDVRNSGNPDLQVAGVLITQVQSVKTDQAMEEALRQAVNTSKRGLRVFDHTLPLRAAYKAVQNEGRIMADAQPDSEYTGYFRSILSEALAIIGGVVSPDQVLQPVGV